MKPTTAILKHGVASTSPASPKEIPWKDERPIMPDESRAGCIGCVVIVIIVIIAIVCAWLMHSAGGRR